MCGIAGILDPRGVHEDDVRRMAETLAHRGPEDDGLHMETHLGFGFRRLAIIDLETGNQPIPNEDETVWVMLNGEIYNYRELRTELLARGHRFRSRSDTEVLVHLYEDHGADFVHRLRGMFAIALWDRRRRRILLARDHLGQKPLFWARRGERFYFASEIKAILEVAPGLRQVDPVALDQYLSLRVVADPRSMFVAVHKLPPAHVLHVGMAGEPVVYRYWDLSFEPKPPMSESEALEALDECLRETVRLHLVSDVPVGSFLSGGVDSGLLTAVAQEVSGEPLRSFAGSVPYREFDEAPLAARVAAHCGTRHFEYRIGGDLIALLPRLVHHMDEPSDPLSACFYELARGTRNEVKVVFGGEGGDERFGGYDRYYAMGYAGAYGRLPAALRQHVFRRILDRVPDGFWYKSLSHRLRWMDELANLEGGRRYARSLSYFFFTPRLRERLYTDHFRALVDGVDPEAEIIAWYEDDRRVKEELDRMLLADSMVREPNHSITILDRMSMAHGLEARSPFLDHELAQFAATLPVNLKVRGRKRRYLQMRLAERYLPQELLASPKLGFQSGLPYLMAEQFRTLFAHYLRDAHMVGAGLLRPEPIRGLLKEHLARRTDHGNRLWLLLNAELWHRIRIEDHPVDQLEDEVRFLLRSPATAPPPDGTLPARAGDTASATRRARA